MEFDLRQAVRQIVCEPFTTAVMIITFIGGFLAIFIATGFTDAFLSDLSCYRYGDPDDYYAWVSTSEKFPRNLPSDVCVVGGYYSPDSTGGNSYISAVGKGYEKIFRDRLVSGRRFSDDEYGGTKYVCIIESTLAVTREYSIGDFCEVMGNECEIIGIVQTNAWNGRIIVPAELIGSFRDSEFCLVNYEIVVKSPAPGFSIKDLISGSAGSRFQVSREGRSNEIYRKTVGSSLGKASAAVLAAILIFIYALLNVLGIAEFRRDAKSSEIGVRLALGAHMRRIYLQVFFEYLILMILSIAALFALSPLIAYLLRGVISWRSGIISIVCMPTVAVIFSFVMTLVITNPLARGRTSITDLMTGRWRAD